MNRRSNRMLQIASISLLLAVTVAAWPSADEQSAPSEPGDNTLFAPDFTLHTLDGEAVTLSEMKGKVVLVNFWATWCAPCRYEIPDLSRIYTKYHDQGLEIYGISVDDIESQKLVQFGENYKMTYPILHGSQDEIQRLTQIYGGIYSIPTTFIINRAGIISDIFVGARREQDFLTAILPLL